MTRQPRPPWPEAAGAHDDREFRRGGAAHAELLVAQRLLQDRLAGSALPPDVTSEVTARLLEICELTDGYAATEDDRRDGWRPDLPGRGHLLLPPYVVNEASSGPDVLHGTVTFTRVHLGGGAAAHGGAQPLLFDDVFGRVANQGRAVVARTAYLTVNYRQVTPLDVALNFEATLDRVEGRKRWTSGRLTDAAGATLCEADALFVELRVPAGA